VGPFLTPRLHPHLPRNQLSPLPSLTLNLITKSPTLNLLRLVVLEKLILTPVRDLEVDLAVDLAAVLDREVDLALVPDPDLALVAVLEVVREALVRELRVLVPLLAVVLEVDRALAAVLEVDRAPAAVLVRDLALVAVLDRDLEVVLVRVALEVVLVRAVLEVVLVQAVPEVDRALEVEVPALDREVDPTQVKQSGG
jgi:hypothetical protein